jgi:hypothetical protein
MSSTSTHLWFDLFRALRPHARALVSQVFSKRASAGFRKGRGVKGVRDSLYL